MRFTTLTLIALCFNFIDSKAASALFYLKVETPSVFQFDCSLRNAQNEPISYRVKLKNGTNDVNFAIDITEPQIVTFQYGASSFNLFIEPDNDLKFYFNAKNIIQTLRFEGSGAENNTCLANFTQTFRANKMGSWYAEYLKPNIDIATESTTRGIDADTYLNMVNMTKESELDFLSAWKAKINKTLYSYLFKDAVYTHDTKLYAYFLLNDYLDKAEIRQVSAKFFNDSGFNYTDYERNETPVFINALKTYIHYQTIVAKYEPDAKTLYDIIGNKLEGYDRFYLQKELLLEVFKKTNDATLAKQKYEVFYKNCPYKNLIQDLKLVFDANLDGVTREQAPDLTFVLSDGGVSKLANLKGKVVYISFWASWCKPCIEGFQKYSELRQKLQTEGIVLLNLNIDDDISKYQAFLMRLNLQGINAQPLDMLQTKKDFSVFTIPAYFIVDKNGAFVTLPNKEGRDVVSEFKKLVTAQ